MDYIQKNKIYIHVHFLSLGEASLIDELFSENSKINKDNKLSFMRYIKAQPVDSICRSCTKFKTVLLKESIRSQLNV